MLFNKALELMKQGVPMKLPSWGGYWCWNGDKQTIEMHCRVQDSDTGVEVLDIRETQRVEYTIQNILSDEWIVAHVKNCPLLGGEATFTFSEALKYIKRGLKVARKSWNGKGQYVFLAENLEFNTKADLSEFNPSGTEECTEENAVSVYDCLVIRTADKKLQVGWLATQSDLLADDWCFVE